MLCCRTRLHDKHSDVSFVCAMTSHSLITEMKDTLTPGLNKRQSPPVALMAPTLSPQVTTPAPPFSWSQPATANAILTLVPLVTKLGAGFQHAPPGFHYTSLPFRVHANTRAWFSPHLHGPQPDTPGRSECIQSQQY